MKILILRHIMKHYAHHGFREFLIALGYKGEAIKRYFVDYSLLDLGRVYDRSPARSFAAPFVTVDCRADSQ